MNKPEEIIELERIYGITLNEGKPDEKGYIYHNTYVINKDGAVTHLNLSSNRLSEIKGLDKFRKLQYLSLSNNQLSEIKGLEKLVFLTTLRLSYNQLREIKGLEKLVFLRILWLDNNQLSDIKGLEKFGKLKYLQYLSINNNPFLQKTDLKLDYNENHLSDIKSFLRLNKPKEIIELERNYGITLKEEKPNRNENVNRNAYAINEDGAVTHLNLSDNQLSEIKGLQKLGNLQTLDLSNNQLSEIKGLEMLGNLQWLNLSNNQLSEIKGLEKLGNLQTLSLLNNELSEVKGLEKLVNLKRLSLSNNKLSEIKGLETLGNLKMLILSHNELSEIKGLETLENLQWLWLYNNQLSEIKGLETLVDLQELDLSYNQLSEIKGLEMLKNLRKLYLSNNQLTEISGLNPVIKSLEDLRMNNNPFLQETNLRLDSNENHLSDIRFFLSNNKNWVILPAKVMLLGNHAAGKSSFLYYLQNGELPEESDQSDKSTHILNIEKYSNPKQPKQLAAMIYDFGGQDYYHGLYQAFFSLNSINLLFWCEETDFNNEVTTDKDINGKDKELVTRNYTREYWLHQLSYAFIKLFNQQNNSSSKVTEESVTIIQTHADTGKYKIFTDNSSRLTVTNNFYLSLSKKAVEGKLSFSGQLENLRTTLLEAVNDKERKSPLRSRKFFDYIMKQKRSEHIKITELFDEFLTRINDKGNIGNEDKHNELEYDLNQLALSGVVLYYRDNKKLNDVAWVCPAKTIKTIHNKILSKGNVLINKKGSVDGKDFEKLCGDDKIREMLLMEKVIFYDKNNKDGARYIIPGYLPLSFQDKYYQMMRFDFTSPNFVLKFRYFIPFGLINELICFYGNNPDDKMFWRDQLIFTLNGEYKVWIKLDFSQLTISVYINLCQGQTPKLKLKEIEKLIFLNIIDLYWNREICYKSKKEFYSGAEKDPHAEETAVGQFVPIEGKCFVYQEKDPHAEETAVGPNNDEISDPKLFIKQVRAYIEEKIDSPDDMYLSTDGKYFVHHRNMETIKEPHDRITVYTIPEEQNPTKEIDTSAPKTFSVYPFKNFSNNPVFKKMKKIFISYSRKDVEYKDELKKHLNMLYLFDIADNWSCDQITIGKWHEQIQKELEESDLIIYMLSANFFTSTYILDEEVQKGMEHVSRDPSKKILCVIVSEFVGLDKLEKAMAGRDLNARQEAIIGLGKWQFLSYATIVNGVTGNKEEKLVPLKRHPHIEEALATITEKIVELFTK
jgi:internalin A